MSRGEQREKKHAWSESRRPPHWGVAPHRNKFHAYLRDGHKRIGLGYWPTARQAALAHDRAVLHFDRNVPVNFPKLSQRFGPAPPEELVRAARLLAKKAAVGSRYIGVRWDNKVRGWMARGRYGRYLGVFPDEQSAALARDRVMLFERRDATLNFERSRIKPASAEEMQTLSRRLRKQKTGTSRFHGVYYEPDVHLQPWVACLMVKGRKLSLGTWQSERDAAIASDRAMLFYGVARKYLNFPEQVSRRRPASAEILAREARALFKQYTSSRFRGVCRDKRRRCWRASIRVARRLLHLGLFDDENKAARAYDRAAEKWHGHKARLNFA